MTRWGKVTAAKDRYVHTELAAPAFAGDQDIRVADIEVLDWEGGRLLLGQENRAYTIPLAPDPESDEVAQDDTEDVDEGMVHLGSPLAVDHDEDARVFVLPLVRDQYAAIQLVDQPEEVLVRVPQRHRHDVNTRIRSDLPDETSSDSETVELGHREDEHVITDLVGAEADLTEFAGEGLYPLGPAADDEGTAGSLNVGDGDGIVVTADEVAVGEGEGITVGADDVAVNPGDGLYNEGAVHVGAGFGIIANTDDIAVEALLGLNVLNHGLVADSIDDATPGTDNTAALQALIDFVHTLSVGRPIYVPAGTYRVDGPVNIPRDCSIRIVGAGKGWSLVSDGKPHRISRFRRRAGDEVMFSTNAAEFGPPDHFPNLELADIALDGGKDLGLTECGALLACNGAVYLRLRDVNFRSNDGFGLQAGGLLNSNITDCYWHACGRQTLDPALVDRAPAFQDTPACLIGVASGTGGSNTVTIANCEWEDNYGVDFYLDGEEGASPADKIMGVNFKMEGVGDGGAYAYFQTYSAHTSSFSNIEIASHRPAAALVIDGDPGGTVGQRTTKFANLGLHQQTGGPAPYMLNHRGWGLQVVNAMLSAAGGGEVPVNAWRHIGADVAPQEHLFIGQESDTSIPSKVDDR